MLKRAFDVLFAAAVLLLLSPLLLGVAAWIRLDSRGPVLFRQLRVGRDGREFRILKFRTMHVDAPARGPQITVGRDPRITRAGHFLRKYKIDEFPQFINVLVGDMSVVGPRPEVPRYVAMYPPATRDLVLSVRPGITDLASIEYRDENELLGRSADPERTYVEQVMPAKLAYCERYVQERSFAGDIGIIGRTIAASFVNR
ncbi:MAG: sugar transferase [Proteobacteria bacterium]|uniref:sugar transferase n=1 Tax=Piscinibacter sp. TaxID=1903157 RepID=UPI001B5DA8C0|nr:sugar transferase [Piscinibacter sp.]MBP5988452.1 sugar transferase [Piscinibacter sp.]MBP6026060.1 sugar transferase [Piscinibacter sp.]MBS0436400.1 sugar transferase [Pseudomonadota bacterium]MBS0442420.1 sugar transferase [Pseudomonadota bacterium]